MSRYFKLLFLVSLVLLTCRERTNIFDPQNEQFASPPPYWYTLLTGAWVTQEGYLVGVQLEVHFIDQFSKALPINNYLYRSESEFADAEASVPLGASSYTVDLIGSSIMDIGFYEAEYYFGELALGSIQIEVIEGTNGLFIKGVTTYDTLDMGHRGQQMTR